MPYPNPNYPPQQQSQQPYSGGPQEQFPDQSDYVTARHVAVLKEHDLNNASDGEPNYIGPYELQQIANNNNKRIVQTGDATPIVLGHTTDGEPETEQPEIVGYATNFHVAPLFETGKTALFADFHVRREEKDRVNKYFPRRSVEFWPRRLEVDPISLLGATTPEQDLGLVQFSRAGKHYHRINDTELEVVRYSRRGEAEYGRTYLFEDDTVSTQRPRQYAHNMSDDLVNDPDMGGVRKGTYGIVHPHPRGEDWDLAGDVMPEHMIFAPEKGGDPWTLQHGDFRIEDHPNLQSAVNSANKHGYRHINEDVNRGRVINTPPSRNARQYAANNNDNCRSCACDDGGCPCCRGKCKSPALIFVHRDGSDKDGTPMCEGCAADALECGFKRGHTLAPVQQKSQQSFDVKKQAPFKPKKTETPQKKSRGNAMAGHSYPSSFVRPAPPFRFPGTNGAANGNGVRRYAADPMGGGGDSPPDEGDAKLIEGVLQSAPIQEIIQGQQQFKSQLDEIMQLLQSQAGGGMGGQQQPSGMLGDEQGGMPPGQMGGDDAPPDEEARWMNEPHDGGGASDHDGPPEQYMDDEEEDPEQYAADCGPMQYDHDGSGDYTMDDDEESADVTPHQYGAYASADNGYIQNEQYAYKPRAGHMGGHHGGIHPGSKRRHSRVAAEGSGQQPAQQPQRTKSQFEIYMESLRGGDEKVKYARLEQTVKQQQVQIGELALERRQYSRAETLRTVQITEGIDMDVAEELTRTITMDDAAFTREVDHIKKRYKRDVTAMQPVRLSDYAHAQGGGPQSPPEASMDHDSALKYSRRLAEGMMKFRRQKPDAPESELIALARADIQKQPA